MKKLLSIVFAVMLICNLTACSISDVNIEKPDNVSPNSPNTPADEVTIAETVLLEEAGVKITAKSLSFDNLFGPSIKLLIENNSGKNLTFQARNVSVNGYMIGDMLSADVADGKKANDTLTLMESDLELCGIETIADIELSFHIFTTDDWDTYLDTPQIQLKTSAANTYEYKFDDSGDLAYNKDGIKIVIKGLAKDSSIFGPSIVVYIENTGKKNITVQTRDVSINGFMVDPLFSADALSGKRAISTITFMESELEENDITEIEDVELSFHVFDADSWDTIKDTDPITISYNTK